MSPSPIPALLLRQDPQLHLDVDFSPDFLFETILRHLLQIHGNYVFLPYKTLWITEAPSMIVKNRFFFGVFVIVVIVVDLDKI